MEKSPNCRCSLTSLVALIILVLFPLMSECKVDTYTSLKEAKDMDYGSFVGLMGRRSAAHPNRRMAHTLADLVNHWCQRFLQCDM
ncbi:hypothetical protein CgunFtcFv8_014305 [Champsocephalus gunnari]|uniref:Uncharacterized protein n=2 Tax=Champsocephalus gunnari TaxID=52237 RepID=A0AAN8E692_CHAGU|nr:hypothetical protein CgunFtcFv8_014305 [Champsocephalus gunnari]